MDCHTACHGGLGTLVDYKSRVEYFVETVSFILLYVLHLYTRLRSDQISCDFVISKGYFFIYTIRLYTRGWFISARIVHMESI